MSYNKEKVALLCDRFMEFNIYLLAFFLPISKAIIEITVTLAIFVFFIKKIVLRQSLFKKTYLNLPLFVFLFLSAISIIGSNALLTSLRNLFFKLIEQILLFFVIVEVINTRQKARKIIYIMLASSFLVGVDGIFQYFTHKDFLRSRKMIFLKRINASFYTPNDLGAYLVPMAILSLSMNFEKIKNVFLKIFNKILPLLLFINLVLTFSRGAWLGFAIGLVFLVSIALLLKNKQSFILAILLILILILSLPLRSEIPFNKILDFSDAGSIDRRGLWTIAWNMIKERPIFGHGIGTFMHNFRKYDTIGYAHSVSYAHNCYLQMAAEIGISGLLAFFWIIFILFKNSLARIFECNTISIDTMLLGLISSLGAFLVHSTFETNLYSLDLGTLFWIILSLTVSVSTIRISKNE
jgi:putative inorganic carbon (HCO3(-)) transporter